MRKAISYFILLAGAISFISSAHSFNYAHQVDKDEDVKAIYVSKDSKHFFPQEEYSYSFPVFDKKDKDILNTLKRIFGEETYASDVIGTYSISIDYTINANDPFVHRQTGYLVGGDRGYTKESISEGKIVRWKDDDKLLFQNRKGNSPMYLDSIQFTLEEDMDEENSDFKDVIFSDNKGDNYHMENALLVSLYRNKQFFQRIVDEMPHERIILGVCIKVYSSYDS